MGRSDLPLSLSFKAHRTVEVWKAEDVEGRMLVDCATRRELARKEVRKDMMTVGSGRSGRAGHQLSVSSWFLNDSRHELAPEGGLYR